MLRSEEVYRQIIEGHIDHSEQPEYCAQLGAFLAFRQVCAKHEVRYKNQQKNELERTARIEGIPDSPDRLRPHDGRQKLRGCEYHSHFGGTCRKPIPLEITCHQERQTSDEQQNCRTVG